jgi:hypothetical protein
MRGSKAALPSTEPAKRLSRPMQEAVRGLALDATAREVFDALNERGVASLLIKGPAVTRWLYTDAPARSYVDVDLLVSDDDRAAANEVLGKLGFESRDGGLTPEQRATLLAERQIARHSETWTRAPHISIDLHRTIVGIGASQSELWNALFAGREPLTVAGGPVDIPGEPARALIVVLEAAKAGLADEKGLKNLERALEIVEEPVWQDAVRLARLLRAEAAFAAGLGLLPAGRELAARLSVITAIDVETALRANAAPATAFGFQRLSETRGLRAKAAFLAAEVVPSRAFMERRFEIARRGRLGLVLAYLWRPLWLMIHAGEGLMAWRHARRDAG